MSVCVRAAGLISDETLTSDGELNVVLEGLGVVFCNTAFEIFNTSLRFCSNF